jgi:hypothetical protein
MVTAARNCFGADMTLQHVVGALELSAYFRIQQLDTLASDDVGEVFRNVNFLKYYI